MQQMTGYYVLDIGFSLLIIGGLDMDVASKVVWPSDALLCGHLCIYGLLLSQMGSNCCCCCSLSLSFILINHQLVRLTREVLDWYRYGCKEVGLVLHIAGILKF